MRSSQARAKVRQIGGDGAALGQAQAGQTGAPLRFQQQQVDAPAGMKALEPQQHILDPWREIAQPSELRRPFWFGSNPNPAVLLIGAPDRTHGEVVPVQGGSDGLQTRTSQMTFNHGNSFSMGGFTFKHRATPPS